MSRRTSYLQAPIRIVFRLGFVLFAGLLTAACALSTGGGTSAPSALSEQSELSVTLLFTNDLESAYEPTTAFWRDDMQNIGGVAQLASLIDNYRAAEANVFLFDAGDIFTGTLARLTRGEIAFELMLSMGYDAMAIGNHEFEFGWEEFARQKNRAPFPVLGANLTYKNGGTPYAQPWAIVERKGIRIGVIGVMGQDAATALIPDNLAGVAVGDPLEAVRQAVAVLRDEVDLVVVLTHQGPTAPMQTNDEAVPEVYRGNAENLALAAAVPGIDVVFAGHTDAGTPTALRDPVNGTLIMQTWGQGQHLGVLQLALERSGTGQRSVSLVHSELKPVNSDELPAHPLITAKLERYRSRHAEIFAPVGKIDRLASRSYYHESSLGNLMADVLVEVAETKIGLMPGGALRKDLPAGVLRQVDLQDAFPFKDRVAVVDLTGEQLAAVIEQGLSLERGLLQVSGLEVIYDPAQPVGQRLVKLSAGGDQVQPEKRYQVATVEILAKGGDRYVQFRDVLDVALSPQEFGAALLLYFEQAHSAGHTLRVPALGRYISRDNAPDPRLRW